MAASDITPSGDKAANDVVAVHTEEASHDTHKETQERPWHVVLKHPKMAMYAMLINIGPLLFGYDMVIIGAVSALRAFKIDFGEEYGESYVIPALWVALWNSLLQIGAGIGSAIAGSFQDRFGRRATVMVGGILGCIGAAVSYTSSMPNGMLERRVAFMFAKAVLGAACGFLMASCQTWISETTPRDLRGLFLGFYAFNVSFGHLIAIVVVFAQSYGIGPSSYLIPFATQWAFAGWAMVVAIILPESPVWLASCNQVDKAQKSLKRLGAEHMLPSIIDTIEEERQLIVSGKAVPSYLECFRGTNLRRTVTVMFLSMIQQFIGMSIMANAAYFLTMAGMSAQYSLMVNVIGISSNMFANMVSWYTIPRYGRRRMILISLFFDCVAWAAMGVAGCFSTDSARWAVGATMVVVGFFNSFGVASAVPVLMSEVSSVRLRSKTAGAGFTAQSISMWAFNFFTPYMYNTNELNWGGKIGFFFAGLGALAFVVTFLVVPETKGRSFSDIDYLFESGIKARKFHKTELNNQETTASVEKTKDF